MNIELVDISTLAPDPANARRHSNRNVEAVKASLMRFGQQTPLVVDTQNIVRVGNARLQAMRELDWTEVRIIRTNLTGAEAIAYAIADNRSGDAEVGSAFDQEALANLLSALEKEDESLLDAAGFTADELVAYLESNREEDPQPQPPAEFPSYDESISTEHICPRCSFRWSGSTQPSEVA
jgi:ParB-like chromosome segregation protein Spo0J